MSGPGAGRAFLDQSAFLLSRDFLPRLLKSVDRLDDEQLWWRPNEHSNSVGNLILHLCGNLRQWVIAGVGGADDRRRRDEEFSARGPVARQELLELLESTVREACRVLEETDPEQLLETRQIQVYDVSLLQAVFHAVEHFSHHLGQILYVTKMLRDTDLLFYDL